MTLDGLTLNALTRELNEKLQNSKIQKVLMPGKEELALVVYSASTGTMRLVLSADAGDCAAYLTSHTKPNPKTAPVFCMFLRKHIVGATISRVEQSGLDRVLTLYLETRDELFRPVQLRLIIEVMGKYSNVILTDEGGRILDCIRHVSSDMSRMRTVLPGIPYERPPQRKVDPLTQTLPELIRVISTTDDTRLDRRLSNVIEGVSMQTAEEIITRAGINKRLTSQLTEADYEALANAVRIFFESSLASPEPCVQLNDEGMPVFFSLVPYAAYPSQSRIEFENVNEMLDYFYTARTEHSRVTQARTALHRTISGHLQKLQRKIRAYEANMQNAELAKSEQNKADIITANLYRLRKGLREFTAVDLITGNEIKIELDPSRTPSEFAQKLYKRIAKSKRTAEVNREMLAEAREEEEFLLGALMYTEEAASIQEISEIKETLADAGYAATQKKGRKTSPQAESEPRRFVSPSGYTVYVGRNDRQNELLTHRLAHKDDIWFHAQRIPGSHVILETHGTPLDDIDDETIVFAAQLAAQYSRAKRSGKTPVDYTKRKHVKKPPHSHPGKVTYDNYYTVYVDAGAASAAEEKSH